MIKISLSEDIDIRRMQRFMRGIQGDFSLSEDDKEMLNNADWMIYDLSEDHNEEEQGFEQAYEIALDCFEKMSLISNYEKITEDDYDTFLDSYDVINKVWDKYAGEW